MLRSVKEVFGYVLSAEDGEIGRCKDFLFDDQVWTIRYMVADTGRWLPGRKVLVSPISLGEPDWRSRRLPVRLKKQQIEGAPDLEEDAPVGRQYEICWTRYFGWPYYWAGTGLWGIADNPGALYVQQEIRDEAAEEFADADRHLRSAKEVTGYNIQATDGEIGHVEDFIMDDEAWMLRYVVVDTRNWLPGRKVLVAPVWIESVDWAQRKVVVGLDQDHVRRSPEYDPSVPVNREYEERLYDFYGRPRYWL